ncbi:Casein kinase II regulatory subunit family protein [Histomonas meleagridis]|uniref:Casein kinase II regulatory subunit family protein n=1 Tax=Histomonas meleagridis TaxID=135588 RepID=UPI00355A0F67|nr:Casein kinase II regulatory subunit family protein [Histomonas meleagridis]KAH0799539.1 Casein kinase II regulatory subunit family protein [Histomonas meleagridis]
MTFHITMKHTKKQIEPVEVDGFRIYPALCGSCPLGYLPWVNQICRIQPWLVEVDLCFITSPKIVNAIVGDKMLFKAAMEIITDRHNNKNFWDIKNPNFLENLRTINLEAIRIYSLIHAKFIVTNKGLKLMKKKINSGIYGKCPRFLCKGNNLIPFGKSSEPEQNQVELYCTSCNDGYRCEDKKGSKLDGSFFGPKFPKAYIRKYRTQKQNSCENIKPTIYGFRLYIKKDEYFVH